MGSCIGLCATAVANQCLIKLRCGVSYSKWHTHVVVELHSIWQSIQGDEMSCALYRQFLNATYRCSDFAYNNTDQRPSLVLTYTRTGRHRGTHKDEVWRRNGNGEDGETMGYKLDGRSDARALATGLEDEKRWMETCAERTEEEQRLGNREGMRERRTGLIYDGMGGGRRGR